MSFIYLATPYTAGGARELTLRKRYKAALKYTAECTAKGEVIFSPIVHSHPMTRCGVDGLGKTWDFWQKIDLAFIDACEKVRVLKLPRWNKSTGVKAEIDYALSIGKIVEYVDPSKV